MTTILPDSAPLDLNHLGGKGHALFQLNQAGFNVPEWFAIAPTFLQGADGSEAFVRDCRFTPGQLEAITRALDAIGGERFAVRSSAIDEDGQSTSFAGQLDSFLEVPAGDVPEKIKAVWASIYSGHLAAYRAANDIRDTPTVPGVIVQRMIEPDTAGVAFSVDVVQGQWSVAMVSAVHGLGEKLVSGKVNGDNWRIGRDGKVIEFTPGDSSGRRILTDHQAHAVADLARACERHFGCPQDIEWALRGDALFLLQSRPITTLARLADPDGTLNIWDNSNIAESYGGVTTPLTYSFAHYIYKEVYQQFCRIMHVPEARIAENRSIFNSMLGLIHGRVYYNLMSWYRMLALLPGFRFNRGFMEQMMGVKEGLPESVLAEFDDARLGARVRDAGRLAWALLGLVRAQIRLPRMIRRFYTHFDQTLTELPAPLTDLRADQLVTHFHDLEEKLLNRWNAPLVNDFFAMIYFGVLRSLTQKWCNDTDGTLQNGLLCGTGNIISAEPAKRIHSMAAIASRDAAWTTQLASADLRTLETEMPTQPEFATEYHAYLDRFADRCLNELKLESPTLRDDPLPLLRSIGNLAQRIRNDPTPRPNIEKELQESSQAELSRQLDGRPLRRWIFNYVLKQARRRVCDRENLRFERTRLFGRIRALFLECGKRLAAVGALETARDVFYLEVYEVIGFVEGTGSTTDLKSLVNVRRAEFERFKIGKPPADRFETRGLVHIGNPFESSRTNEPTAGIQSELSGIGCCPGIVRGLARVITDPSNATLKPGEILVAEQTDPGWITLFPAASGVLVERGSLLSHSAIVSREMGIPAIVSVDGLLASVQTGDLLEFDGRTGKIQKLDPNSHD